MTIRPCAPTSSTSSFPPAAQWSASAPCARARSGRLTSPKAGAPPPANPHRDCAGATSPARGRQQRSDRRAEMAMLRPRGTSGVFQMGAQELVAMAASGRACRRQSDEPGESRGGRGRVGAEHRRLGTAFFCHRAYSGWLRLADHAAIDCDGRDVGPLSAGQPGGSVSDRAASACDDLEHRPKLSSRDRLAA